MQGYDAVMFTGTAEHARKWSVRQAAGVAPEDYTTRVANRIPPAVGLFGMKVIADPHLESKNTTRPSAGSSSAASEKRLRLQGELHRTVLAPTANST